MEKRDRDTIQRNIKLLSELVQLEPLYRELISKGVIDRSFIERIQAKYNSPSEQAQEFFLCYTKRGPTAFQNLVEALQAIGYISEADTLERSRQINNHHQSPQHTCHNRNGHSASPTSTSSLSPSTSSSTSLPSSPLMRIHSHTGASGGGESRVFDEGNMSTSSSSVSVAADQMRRMSLSSNSNYSNSFAELPPLEIRVRHAERIMVGQSSAAMPYTMQSNPRGFALIINNIEFEGDSDATREGAEKDTTHLQQLFEQLGYKVMIRHNVRQWDLVDPDKGIIKRFIDQFRTTEVDSCIVAIMSHGKEGHYIRAHDAEDTRNPRHGYWNFYDDIVRRFNNRYCPVLNGKPKMFIVQACLGHKMDRGVRRRTQVDTKSFTPMATESVASGGDDDWNSAPQNMPETEDIVACFSTIPGFVSNRDPEFGTWYIRCLCKVFMESAFDTELFMLLRRIGLEMRKINSEEHHKQMCSFISLGFHKELYFNPGIFEGSEVLPMSNGQSHGDDLSPSPTNATTP